MNMDIRGYIQKFPDWVIMKSTTTTTTTTINMRWEAIQRVMAAKLTRLTHKIAIKLHLVAERCTICSSPSGRPVRKLLNTLSYENTACVSNNDHSSIWRIWRETIQFSKSSLKPPCWYFRLFLIFCRRLSEHLWLIIFFFHIFMLMPRRKSWNKDLVIKSVEAVKKKKKKKKRNAL
jgi:hypothetical protein